MNINNILDTINYIIDCNIKLESTFPDKSKFEEHQIFVPPKIFNLLEEYFKKNDAKYLTHFNYDENFFSWKKCGVFINCANVSLVCYGSDDEFMYSYGGSTEILSEQERTIKSIIE